MGSSWRTARIPALAVDVLGGFRSCIAACSETLPFGAIRCLAPNAGCDSRGHLYELLGRRTSVFCAVEGDQGAGCVGPADATHAVHQPGRSDVALDHESD